MNIKELENLLKKFHDSETRMGYYLVRLGKPLWIIGHVSYKLMDPTDLKNIIITSLNSLHIEGDDISSTTPIPFAIECPRDDCYTEFFVGIANKKWIVDIMEWLYKDKQNLPPGVYDSIIGMLCGYDLESIQKYIDNRVKIKSGEPNENNQDDD